MEIRRFRRQNQTWKKIKEFSKTFFHHENSSRLHWLHVFEGAVGGFFVLTILYATIFLPSVRHAEELAFAESTIIYDRAALDPKENPNDHILYVIHGDENREYVPLKEIPKHMINATLAIEDDSFYRHFGFDLGGIIKAALNYFFGIGEARGGSTITQQLVKNTFLTRERTLIRKFNELLLSMKVELVYSKDEILELYLNNIPYGNNAHGVEAAAKTFFGKSVRDLTLGESAILASLPVAPTRFSPFGSNKDLLMGSYEIDSETGAKTYHKGRKDLVLQRMLDLKMISFDEFRQAFGEAKQIEFKQHKTDIRAPHFVFYVRERMEEKYGKEFLKNGGLKIYTTLDPELQRIAEETIEIKSPHFADTFGARNVALVAINPDNGQIMAYVGGKNFWDIEHDGQVDVLTSRRQPGSSFKPFVYASVFEQGYSPATVLFDVETDFGGNYQPKNFDGTFLGPVSMREALNRSLNIPAIKTAFLARPAKVLELASRVGIKFEGDAERHNVAVGIGVAEVEPLSHINAFQAFVGDGSWYEPTAILEVKNSDGEVLETFDPKRTKHNGINPEAAALVRNILTDETTRPTVDGFDWNKLLQLDNYNNGVKTGTSNKKIENPAFDETKPEDEEKNPKFLTVSGDAWTIGFTPQLVSGVWVGNNRGEPMKEGANGMSLAAPIWKRFMLDSLASLVKRGADPNKLYKELVPLQVRKVNKFTGKIATELTPPKLVREEVFASFAVPTELDESVQFIEVDKVSGRPATEYTPFYARTRKYSLTGMKSIRPDLPNWQEPVEEWLRTHPKFLTSLGTIMDQEPDKKHSLFDERRSRLAELPDDVHNRFTSQNAPQVQIVSPKNGGVLTPGRVEVTVNLSAKFGMRAVEFYFDDQLVADAMGSPWTGRFELPSSVELGSAHTLRVVAIDQLFNSGEHEIEVKIAGDEQGPDITFLGPVGKQSIPIGTYMNFLVDVRDASSGVRVVEFFVDGQSLGFVESPPFETSFIANGTLGAHELRVEAWDFHGNVSEKSIPVQYERQKLLQIVEPAIEDVLSYRNSVAVDVTFPDPSQIEWAELIAEQQEQIIFSQKLEEIPKFAQFHILRSLGAGKTEIKLIIKKLNQPEPLEVSKVKVDL